MSGSLCSKEKEWNQDNHAALKFTPVLRQKLSLLVLCLVGNTLCHSEEEQKYTHTHKQVGKVMTAVDTGNAKLHFDFNDCSRQTAQAVVAMYLHYTPLTMTDNLYWT